jgi:hypothetical protein
LNEWVRRPVNESADKHDAPSPCKTIFSTIAEMSQDLSELFDGELPVIVFPTWDWSEEEEDEEEEDEEEEEAQSITHLILWRHWWEHLWSQGIRWDSLQRSHQWCPHLQCHQGGSDTSLTSLQSSVEGLTQVVWSWSPSFRIFVHGHGSTAPWELNSNLYLWHFDDEQVDLVVELQFLEEPPHSPYRSKDEPESLTEEWGEGDERHSGWDGQTEGWRGRRGWWQWQPTSGGDSLLRING